MRVLGLDASSTNIGWVVYDVCGIWEYRTREPSVIDHGTVKLTGIDIADRCRQAYAKVGLILECHGDIDAVAIESPWSGHNARTLIQLSRISGALLALCSLLQIAIVDISPCEAKKELAGLAKASKGQMIDAARRHGITTEHEADALGIAMAASRRVIVERKAA